MQRSGARLRHSLGLMRAHLMSVMMDSCCCFSGFVLFLFFVVERTLADRVTDSESHRFFIREARQALRRAECQG